MRARAAVLGLLVLGSFLPTAAGATTRLPAGDDVGVAVDWSRVLFAEPVGTAVLARSDAVADAFAAGALAGTLGGPLLLHPPGTDELDTRVAAELERVEARRVAVVGGVAAIGDGVVADLRRRGIEVARHAGEDRVATSTAVARTFGPDVDRAYLVRAHGDGAEAFADALGAGMWAATDRRPLLVTASEALSEGVRQHLRASPSIRQVRVVGGTSAVGEAVVDELRALGVDVERIAGPDRYATAVAVAERSYSSAEDVVAVVDGVHPGSWRSGLAAAAAPGGAVVLTRGSTVPPTTQAWLDARSEDQEQTVDNDLVCAPEVHPQACRDAEAAFTHLT